MDVSFPLLVAQMVISLALVVGLIVLMARVVNKRSGGALTHSARRARLTVVGRTSVGQRASVQVVQVAERMLVVGVTDTSVRLLTELQADDVAAMDAQRAEEERAQREAAKNSLVRQWVGRLSGASDPPRQVPGDPTQAVSDQRRHVFESVLAMRKKQEKP